jgi:hypothetical protein
VQRGRKRAAIIGRDPAEDVVFAGLGVIDEDIKITPRGEGVAQGVDQLELGLGAVTEPALLVQQVIRVFDLGILIEHPHKRVARYAVEIIVVFLDVFAMVAFLVGEAKKAFFEKRVALVPEGDRHAEILKPVAESGQAVFVPAINAAAGVVVGEVVPGVAAGAIVFADRAPGPLGEIGAPVFPVGAARPAVA